jgi:transcription antitermination factor NusG
MDSRDAQTWVVLELTPLGDAKLMDGTLEAAIRKDLGVEDDFPVFLPLYTAFANQRRELKNLTEGYVFVGSGLPETAYFKLEATPYIEQVLSARTGPYRMRTLKTVTDSHVQALRNKAREAENQLLQPGMEVKIVSGLYKGLKGVLTEVGKNTIVHVSLRSRDFILSLPKEALTVEEAF